MDFNETIARVAQLRAQAKASTDEANELLAGLDLEVRDYAAGNYIAKVTRTVRFDAATAKKNLTKKEFAAILKPVPDSALAKALLDDRFALCQKEYGLTTKIVPVGEDD